MIGGFLAGYSLDLPINIHAVTSWLPLLIAFTLVEPEREKFSAENHQENFKMIKEALFIDDRLVKFIVLNAMVWGASTLIAVWTFQPFWASLGHDLKTFGVLWAIINLVVGFTGKYAKSVERSLGAPKTLFLMALLPILGYFGMGLASTLWGALFCLCFQVSRGLNQVIVRDALNSRVHGKMRATANSVASLGTWVIFIFFGPMMGYMMDNKGSNQAYFLFAGIFVVCLLVFMLPLLGMRKQFRS